MDTKKFYTLNEAVAIREEKKAHSKQYVLTNGCFDILHAGHLDYLERARALGDCLWIALNADCSVRELKGENRPVNSQEDRAYMLSSLKFVDGVIFFETPRLTAEILALSPDIYVKAGDYTLETLNQEERKALEEVGANIQFLPFVEGYSTTNIIDRIQCTR